MFKLRFINIVFVIVLVVGFTTTPTQAASNKQSGSSPYDQTVGCLRYTGNSSWINLNAGGNGSVSIYNWTGNGWYKTIDICKNAVINSGSYTYKQHYTYRYGQTVVTTSHYKGQYDDFKVQESWTLANGIVKNHHLWIDGNKMY